MREAVRVALLARPGAGGDRLRQALEAAGAELVLDADPTTLDPDRLAGAGPQSIVVVLDAAVEDALVRLDAVLHDPAIDVLYEESEVAAAREGWDAARWTRHLSAKLQRHDDVLPPARDADRGTGPAAHSAFDPVDAEYQGDASPEPVEFALDAPGPAATDTAPETDDRGGAIRDFRRDLAGIEQRIASMSLVGDDGPAEAAPSGNGVDAPSARADGEDADTGPGVDTDPGARTTVDRATTRADAAPTAGSDAVAQADAAPAPGDDLQPLSFDAEPPAAAAAATASGAVLVFAGIGGPDAVRQFLGALPPAFPLPVLIHQRLDGGRHDRLVQQMARATTLPVALAEDGVPAAPGNVYVLPPGLGLAAGGAGLVFAAGADPMATLPPDGSAVLMFSGSDTAQVDAAMALAATGTLVCGQSPEDCYDAAAAEALVSRGAESGQPAELARRLAARWAA